VLLGSSALCESEQSGRVSHRRLVKAGCDAGFGIVGSYLSGEAEGYRGVDLSEAEPEFVAAAQCSPRCFRCTSGTALHFSQSEEPEDSLGDSRARREFAVEDFSLVVALFLAGELGLFNHEDVATELPTQRTLREDPIGLRVCAALLVEVASGASHGDHRRPGVELEDRASGREDVDRELHPFDRFAEAAREGRECAQLEMAPGNPYWARERVVPVGKLASLLTGALQVAELAQRERADPCRPRCVRGVVVLLRGELGLDAELFRASRIDFLCGVGRRQQDLLIVWRPG
jgi:hypothetical protein